MRLQVPHHPQESEGYCLPACVEMVLAYWGINRDQSSLARQLKVVEGFGALISRVYLLVTPELDIRVRKRGELSDLVIALEQGIPPIAAVWTGQLSYWEEAAFHAVVVVGIEGEGKEQVVVLNDPALPEGKTEVAEEEFYLAWDEMDNVYALLKKLEH